MEMIFVFILPRLSSWTTHCANSTESNKSCTKRRRGNGEVQGRLRQQEQEGNINNHKARETDWLISPGPVPRSPCVPSWPPRADGFPKLSWGCCVAGTIAAAAAAAASVGITGSVTAIISVAHIKSIAYFAARSINQTQYDLYASGRERRVEGKSESGLEWGRERGRWGGGELEASESKSAAAKLY